MHHLVKTDSIGFKAMAIISFECTYCNRTGSVTSGLFVNPCPVCGGVVNIEIDVPQGSILVDCRYCNGSGGVSAGLFINPCPVCKGFGKNQVHVPSNSKLANCKYCNGSGSVFSGFFSVPCSVCHGTGFSTPKRLSLAGNSQAPIQPSRKTSSCFICYGEPDKAFAEKLRNALNNKEIPTWMYSMDYTPGRRTWKEIIDNRRISHKVLVICSTASLSRDGILKEIEQQIDENPDKIIPVSIDLDWTESTFIIRRGDTDLKPFLSDHNYADFVTKTFNEALAKLAKAIKQSL